MAKRFIDTGFYSSPFVRGLRGPYKALFNYLFLNCDHAGVWQVELDVACTRLDQKRIDPDEALRVFAGKVIALPGGSKWFVVDFIEFQYGELNPANRAHSSVLAILKSNGIDPSTLKKEGATKGLVSPSEGGKDMDMDMDKELDKDQEKERAIAQFEALWILYERHGTKNLARDKWLHLSQADRDAIAQAAPGYVNNSFTDGRFPSRKYLEGWITPANRLWERPVLVREQPLTASEQRKRTEAPNDQPITIGRGPAAPTTTPKENAA
jgi:hypothetical protein